MKAAARRRPAADLDGRTEARMGLLPPDQHVLSRWVMAAGGGAPAYDVDHEVFVLLDRFKYDQNLVINMILGRGWPGGW